MESRALNLFLGLLSVLSFIWSFISKENRIIAITLGFILIILTLISEKNIRLENLESEQKRLNEKLNIYKELINMKADIKRLQKGDKNAKRK